MRGFTLGELWVNIPEVNACFLTQKEAISSTADVEDLTCLDITVDVCQRYWYSSEDLYGRHVCIVEVKTAGRDQTLIQPQLPDDAPPGHGDGGSSITQTSPDILSRLPGRCSHVE